MQKPLLKKAFRFIRRTEEGILPITVPGNWLAILFWIWIVFFTDIHKYLRLLEECVIDTLADFDISASRSKGETGVWIDVESDNPRKICAMGIRTSRWVTMHGFALNVNTDLSFFDYIIPCGIRNKGVTSMQKELGVNIDLQEVSDVFQKHFAHHFEADVR